jgi:hypothetical protein
LMCSGSAGPEAAEFSPSHPWGCNRRRIPDRVVFEHLSTESVASAELR